MNEDSHVSNLCATALLNPAAGMSAEAEPDEADTKWSTEEIRNLRDFATFDDSDDAIIRLSLVGSPTDRRQSELFTEVFVGTVRKNFGVEGEEKEPCCFVVDVTELGISVATYVSRFLDRIADVKPNLATSSGTAIIVTATQRVLINWILGMFKSGAPVSTFRPSEMDEMDEWLASALRGDLKDEASD